MKNIFLMLLFLLTNSCAQKQTNYDGFEKITHNSQITALNGKWRISTLIANSEAKEYLLSSQSPDRYENYGNNISINPDQTFESGYSAECGNDCFTTTKGKYKIIDENYICFYLEEIIQSGECSGNSKPNKDLGLYYYYKIDNAIHLLKSKGTLEIDKKNVEYYNLLTNKHVEISQFIDENQLMHRWTKTALTNDEDIVAFCMNDNKVNSYELLHINITDSYRLSFIALIKIDGEFRYVIYHGGNKEVSLFDDSNIDYIDKFVDEIDKNKSLKSNTYKEIQNPRKSAISSEITVYKKNNEIYKVEQSKKHQNTNDKSRTTIYFKNLIPIYIESETDIDYNKEILVSKTGIYVYDWEKNKAVTKNIVINIFGNTAKIYYEKPKIIAILAEIKN